MTSIPLRIVKNDPSCVPIDELQNLSRSFKQSVSGCKTSTYRKINFETVIYTSFGFSYWGIVDDT